MHRAHRGFAAIATATVLLTALGSTTTEAQEPTPIDEQLFPRPAALEPAVQFWTRVYTEVTTREGFIHDDELFVVYQTIKVPDDMSGRERRRRVERSLETYRAIVAKLAGGARSNLNAEEQRVLALFPEGTTNAELRAATQRLRFQLGQSDRFRAGLVRSGTWRPYIRDAFAKQGLPVELSALPHVESSFDPTAYSKVGAAGMWQFMRSTGVRYMRIDHIIDERRDPFLATDAATRLLADNFSVLQSWPLALTAYNHGVAGMRRATIQQKTTDIATIVAKYQSRSFGFASRNFYTAFLAALTIDSDPQKYFPGIKLNAPSDTEIVTVPDFMHADTLAKALNVREGALRELNPALMDTVWAGDKFVPKGFSLRVPLATAAVAEDLLAAVDAAERFAGQRPDLQHRVRRGDTLSAIAAEYHVSLAALMRANGLSARDMIRVGQMISLPVDSRGTAAPAATVVLARADPSPPSTPSAAPSSPVMDGTYTVRNGDSIDRIAKRLKVSAEELLAANTLGNKNLIYPGQKLNVPGAAAEVPVTAVVAANTEPATVASIALATAPRAVGGGDQLSGIATDELEAALAPAVLANGEPAPAEEAATALDDEGDVNVLASVQADLAADPSDYSVSATNQIQVQALETLGHYADWLEIPTQRLRDLNSLSFREAVVIGQMLTLDFGGVDAPTFEARRVAFHQQQQGEFFAAYQIEDIESHTIRSGESLWVLAARTYKVPVWLLRQYNPDLNLDRVMPGTVVKFPRLKKAVGGQDAAAPVAAPAAVVAPAATVAERGN